MNNAENKVSQIVNKGIDSLSDVEMISIVASVTPTFAKKLLSKVGNILELYKCSIEDLKELGLTEKKAVSLKASFGLTKRLQEFKNKVNHNISHPAEVAEWIREEFRGKIQEEFWVMCLNTRNDIIKCERITIGIIDRCYVHSREIFKFAIKNNSSKIILIHNHPSGDPVPSRADIDLTQNTCKAGEIIGIHVIDHIIIGDKNENRLKDWSSLRELNLL